MTSSSINYSIGYFDGQIALINTIISNCEDDIRSLNEDILIIKEVDAPNALIEYNGKLKAIQLMIVIFQEAYIKLKRREKQFKLANGVK